MVQNKLLSYFLYSLVSLLLLSSISCSHKHYRRVADDNKHEIVPKSIFPVVFDKAIYTTTINIFNRELTGLTIIKRTDSSFRFVSMSELGIKYMDIEFPFFNQSNSKVIYIIEPLNKPMLLKLLLNNIGLLFYMPTSNTKAFINDKQEYMIKDKNLRYILTNKLSIIEISKTKCLFSENKLLDVESISQSYPKKIAIGSGNIRLNLKEIPKN